MHIRGRIASYSFAVLMFFTLVGLERYGVGLWMESRFGQIASAISTYRGYQGLVLDTPGIASLIVALNEKSAGCFIERLEIRAASGQILRRSFSTLHLPFIHSTWFSKRQIAIQIDDLIIKASVRLPLYLLILVVFTSAVITSAIIGCYVGLRSRRERRQKIALADHIKKVSQQVAHDIRSPMAALKVTMQHMAAVPEEQRVLIRNAVQRIDDIVNDLAGRRERLEGYHFSFSEVDAAIGMGSTTQLLSALIETLVSEKRFQYRGRLGVEISAALGDATYGVFALIQAVEFKRLLSNLINNAVEALSDAGRVTVRLSKLSSEAMITVQDTGKGIPPDRLPQLAQRGATFEKAGGSGLGLYHAKTTVEAWGGELAIASEVGTGTTVTMRFPMAASPDWFVPEVVLGPGTTVVIVDDDASIHQIWESRFGVLQVGACGIAVHHFSDPRQCIQWVQTGSDSFNAGKCLFLCDYEFLGSNTNGVQLIEALSVAAQAILVTSHYEDPPVREACAKLGVRLIPKGLAGFVPICLNEPAADASQAATVSEGAAAPTVTPTILVLDDDDGIRLAWQLEQPRLGIGTLHAHASMEACMASAPDLAQIDCAFVDKHIKGSDWTLEATIKHLKAGGVKKVVVASGESAKDLAADPVCALADGILPDKIPESLKEYVVDAVSAVEV